MALRDASIARRTHYADPFARFDALTRIHFDSAEVSEKISNVVVTVKCDRQPAAGARSVDFFYPQIFFLDIKDDARSGGEHVGVTTVYICGGIIEMISRISYRHL